MAKKTDKKSLQDTLYKAMGNMDDKQLARFKAELEKRLPVTIWEAAKAARQEVLHNVAVSKP